ncbi:toll/interleukin-1 receptor domain-containing protein [Alteriqipengyuania sp. 357]
MAEIFVSHSTADRELAQLFVDLLKEGIGVPEKAIFCSSIKGHGIPFGEDFNEYMKSQIQTPNLVFLLMTPSYLERPFCLMELGAAWAKSLKALPVVMPGVSFDNVSNTLGLKQGWLIEDETGLIDLRLMVRKHVNVEERDDHTWEKKRAAWKVSLKKVLKDLARPSKVPAAEHNALKASAASQANEIEALQSLLEDANEKIEILKNVKDAVALKDALATTGGTSGVEAEFEELLDAVKATRPSQTSNSVFKHIILDFFDLSPSINWFAVDREEFERAIQYKLLSPEDGHPVKWDGPKLKPLHNAINAVVAFLQHEEGAELARQKQAEGEPMEPDDLAFWEWHLTI